MSLFGSEISVHPVGERCQRAERLRGRTGGADSRRSNGQHRTTSVEDEVLLVARGIDNDIEQCRTATEAPQPDTVRSRLHLGVNRHQPRPSTRGVAPNRRDDRPLHRDEAGRHVRDRARRVPRLAIRNELGTVAEGCRRKLRTQTGTLTHATRSSRGGSNHTRREEQPCARDAQAQTNLAWSVGR